MKKIILIFVIVSAVAFPAFSAETGGSFTIGNNNLTASPMTTAEFPGNAFPWGASLFWKKPANDISGIEIGFYRDPILKNLGYTNFYYNDELFNIEVGPFFGLFNTAETLIKSGIATSMRLNIPGFAFAQFDTQSTIGGRLVSAGDYIQEANNISLGFYVYNAICTILIDTKSYTSIIASGSSQTEDFTEYAFVADIFQKNVPYTVQLKIGYQQKVRTLEAVSIERLNSIVLGTDLKVSPFEFLSVFLGIESCVYSFGYLEDSAAGTKELITFSKVFPGNFLYNATVGVSLDLENINN